MPLMREWATRGGGLASGNRELERVLHTATQGLSRSDVDAILRVLTLWLNLLSSESVSRSHDDTPDTATRARPALQWVGATAQRVSTQARPGSEGPSAPPNTYEWFDFAASADAVSLALRVVADSLSLRSANSSRDRYPDAEDIGGFKPQRVDADEADRRMLVRTRSGDREELLSSDEFATRIGLKTRQSVHDWLRRGKIVGWEGAKRGYVFPADQLDELGRPLAGLERVVHRIGNGYAAWIWLTTPLPSLNRTKPLALLRQGESDNVVAAAEGDVQGDFA